MQLPVSRPMGPSEAVLWKLDVACPVTAVVIARLRGPVTEETLRKGLDAVQAKHPLLRMKVVETAERPEFSPDGVPPIPLRWTQGDNDAAYKTALGEFYKPVRAPEGPLLRCVAIRHVPPSVTIVLSVNHAVLDGLSSFYLVQDLCDAMAAGPDGAGDPAPLLGPLESYLPARCRGIRGWVRYASYFLSTLLSFARHGRPVTLNTGRLADPRERFPAFISRQFSPQVSEKLHLRSREQKTTLHGTLSAALLRTVAREFRLASGQSICLGSLTNIRPDLEFGPKGPPRRGAPDGDPKRSIGLYVSSMPTLHRIGLAESFWGLAREVRERVGKGRGRMEDLVLVPASNRLLAGLAAGRDPVQFARLTQDLNFGSVGISNLGSLDRYRSGWGEFGIETFNAVVSPSVLNPLLVTAFTYGGRLTLNFIYMDPVVTRSEADRVADRMFRELEATAV